MLARVLRAMHRTMVWGNSRESVPWVSGRFRFASHSSPSFGQRRRNICEDTWPRLSGILGRPKKTSQAFFCCTKSRAWRLFELFPSKRCNASRRIWTLLGNFVSSHISFIHGPSRMYKLKWKWCSINGKFQIFEWLLWCHCWDRDACDRNNSSPSRTSNLFMNFFPFPSGIVWLVLQIQVFCCPTRDILEYLLQDGLINASF